MACRPKAIGAAVRRHRSGKSGQHLLSSFGNTRAEKRELKKRKEAEFERRARLAKRDLDFRDSPHAPPVTVEERGNRVIETRGRCCLGWCSCGHVSHNS